LQQNFAKNEQNAQKNLLLSLAKIESFQLLGWGRGGVGWGVRPSRHCRFRGPCFHQKIMTEKEVTSISIVINNKFSSDFSLMITALR